MNIRYTMTKNVNREYVITDVNSGGHFITSDRVEANRKLTYIADNELCNVYHCENDESPTLAIIA